MEMALPQNIRKLLSSNHLKLLLHCQQQNPSDRRGSRDGELTPSHSTLTPRMIFQMELSTTHPKKPLSEQTGKSTELKYKGSTGAVLGAQSQELSLLHCQLCPSAIPELGALLCPSRDRHTDTAVPGEASTAHPHCRAQDKGTEHTQPLHDSTVPTTPFGKIFIYNKSVPKRLVTKN